MLATSLFQPIPAPTHPRTMKLFRNLLAMVASSLLSGLPARAEITITAEEKDGNVVFSFSGELDTTDLVDGPSTFGMGRLKPGNPVLLLIGSGVPESFAPRAGLGGPSSLGSGGDSTTNIATGDIFGISPAFGTVILPDGYVSNTPISGSMTFIMATFETLGMDSPVQPQVWTLLNTPADRIVLRFPAQIAKVKAAYSSMIRELTKKRKVAKRKSQTSKVRRFNRQIRKLNLLQSQVGVV